MKKILFLLYFITLTVYAQTASNNWAILDANNKVINVIVASPDVAATYPQAIQSIIPNAVSCINALGSNNITAGIGSTYDSTNNVFITPSPFPSWILNTKTFIWEAPVPKPAEVAGSFWRWNESTKNWVQISFPIITTNNSAPVAP